MKKIILAAMLLAATAAGAAEQKPDALPTTYNLTISREAVNWIGRGLEELPAKVANPIIQDLVSQITAQNEAFKKANAEPAPTKDEPK